MFPIRCTLASNPQPINTTTGLLCVLINCVTTRSKCDARIATPTELAVLFLYFEKS